MSMTWSRLSDPLLRPLMFAAGHDGKYLTLTNSKAALSLLRWDRLSLSIENHVISEMSGLKTASWRHIFT